MESWTGHLLLFVAGAVSGVVNVIAGGGSFLTLPILMFLGLPAGVANGTNRVGILLQNVAAVWSFRRHGLIEARTLLWSALPATIGAVAGSWLALHVSDELFKRLLAFLMVAVSLWTLWAPPPHRADGTLSRLRRLAIVAAFVAVGVYGGFVQAGVGFLVLAATSAAGLDLVRGNALKVTSILCFTVLSLVLFAWSGKVEWVAGLNLAVGNTLGGLLGARLTVAKGHRWVRGVVTATVILFALELWLAP